MVTVANAATSKIKNRFTQNQDATSDLDSNLDTTDSEHHYNDEVRANSVRIALYINTGFKEMPIF
jgi:hypothetical protein